MKILKVIVVDDEPIVRTGLENWLSPNYIVSSFDSADAFLNAYENFELEDGLAACILLDFQMPGMNGVELQDSLKTMNVDFPIIFMSGNAEQADIINAWRGGAVDFILKPFTPDQISVALNRQFDRLSQRSAFKPKAPDNKATRIPITKREAEVLIHLANGRHQLEVAQILGISIRTVKMYRLFLKNKLELHTLAELGRFYNANQAAIERISENIS
jgi:FixJ family two-component response regulator